MSATFQQNSSSPLVRTAKSVPEGAINLHLMPAPDIKAEVGTVRVLIWGTIDVSLFDADENLCSRSVQDLAEHIHHQANGVFFVLLQDHEKQLTMFFVDRFSCKKIFFTEENNTIYFSDSFASLHRAKGKTDPDPCTLVQMLVHDYVPTNHTLVPGLFSVRPFTIYSWDGDSLLEKAGKIPRSDPSPQNYADCVSNAFSILESSFLSETKGHKKLIVPLSGGQDSRLLLGLALKHFGPENVSTYTFGQPGTLDYEIGCGLAKTFSIPSKSYAIGKNFLAEHVVPSTRFMHGLSNHISAPSCFVGRAWAPADGLIVSGYVGDLVMGTKSGRLPVVDVEGLHYPEPKQMSIAEALRLIPAARPAIKLRLNELARHLSEVWQPTGIPMESWYYAVRITTFTAVGLFSERESFRYITPFVNRSFLDFCLRVPPQFKTSKFVRDIAYSDKVCGQLFDFPLKNLGGAGGRDYSAKALIVRARFSLKAALRGATPKQNFANARIINSRALRALILENATLSESVDLRAIKKEFNSFSYSQQTMLAAISLHLQTFFTRK